MSNTLTRDPFYREVSANGLTVVATFLNREKIGEVGFEFGHDRSVVDTLLGKQEQGYRPEWRCLLRLGVARERRTLMEWLDSQRKHIAHKDRPWVHPRYPTLRFERVPDRTSAGVFKVRFISEESIGQPATCTLPVDVLMQMLAEMGEQAL